MARGNFCRVNLASNPRIENSLPAQLNISWVRRFAKRFPMDTLIPTLFVVVHAGVNQTSKRLQRLRFENVRVYDGTGTIQPVKAPLEEADPDLV